MTKTSLAKIFVVAAAAALASGCAITPVGTCNKKCRLEQAARMMSKSQDPGLKAVGVRTLEKLHPELKAEAEAVRRLALPETLNCTVSAVETKNGQKIIKMSNCAAPVQPLP